jgi:LemA protein
MVILSLVVIAILGYGIVLYNRLVALRERFRNAFSQIDVQLRRRYDLIPNLVETARGYMQHERETLEAVIRARTQALQADEAAAKNPGAPALMMGLLAAEHALGGLLTRFFGLVEAYPDLKASQNMLQLQEELASTENRIAFARQAYNDAVMRYNAARASFPANLLAGGLGFGRAAFFEVESEAERSTPNVSLG